MPLLFLILDTNGLIFAFVAFVAAYLYATRNFAYWKKRRVMEIAPWAFFGNFAQCLLMRKSPGDYFRDLYQLGKNERFVGYFVLDQPQLMIRDPELIRHVLIKDFHAFADRNVSTSKDDIIGKENLFLAKEPKWRMARQTMSKFFSSGRMKKIYGSMRDTAKDLDKYLVSLGVDGTGSVIDVSETCNYMSNDLIGITLFGMKLNALNDPKSEFIVNGKNILRRTYRRQFEYLSSFFAHRFLKPLRIKFYADSTYFLRKVFQDTLNERSTWNNAGSDIYDFFIQLKRKQLECQKNTFSDDALIAQLAFYYFAGFGTIGTTVLLALYEVARNPDIQNKLRDEMKVAHERDEDGKLTYEMITALPYLDAVVTEILRIYPPLPFLDRQSTMRYTFPGMNVTIDKGTPVVIPLLAIQRDPAYFPNPDVFDPERFYDSNKYVHNRFTYFPFGDGPRICIGMRLGLMQAKFMLAHIFSTYVLDVCKETPDRIESSPFSPFTTSKKNIKLHIKSASLQ